MYILPKDDSEFLELCKLEQFKGRHNVIMTIKNYLQQNDNLSLESFVDLVCKCNKEGWPNWSN